MRLKKDGTPWGNNWATGLSIMLTKEIRDKGRAKISPGGVSYNQWLANTRKGLSKRDTIWLEHVQEACRKVQKIRVANGDNGVCRGMHWYNNGEIEIKDYTRPEGFVRGRLPGQIRQPFTEARKANFRETIRRRNELNGKKS